MISCDFRANGYRLPTEAEWEYAAKGGNKDFLEYEYAGSNNVETVAWHKDNSGNSAHPVGTKGANSLGIYDLSRNVWEWCWDWYGDYSRGAESDPAGPSTGDSRVIRGGSWDSLSEHARSPWRGPFTPTNRSTDVGFRLVRRV